MCRSTLLDATLRKHGLIIFAAGLVVKMTLRYNEYNESCMDWMDWVHVIVKDIWSTLLNQDGESEI